MSVTVIPIVFGALGTVPEGLRKKTGGIGSQRKNRNDPDCCIVEMGQNTEKSPGDLRRLNVT